ncbi:MAG: 4'-phosphopantetheinyl transferase superfamily protein [Pseudomonadales bacterium]|nr:4'-phosphopantetheinyl transferase superfamily protein [Pseudomonadales bacterium]MCP5165744.1 4'-phosphopantetheinyl transferase superfamily protein [Pseudomonadales bacterium]
MTAPSAKKSSDSEGLPPPAADQVHLWLATRDAVTDSDGLTRAVLSRYTGCPPASLAFTRGPHGKPQLLGGARALSFNLSDSGPWLALAVSGAAAVGVDLEFCDPARDVLKLARRCFRAAEIADMEAREGARLLDRFYDYWTLKEAGVKAVGGSLGRELQTTGFALTGGKPGAPESIEALEPATENCWYGLLEPLPQYRLALCCLGGADFSRGLRLLQWPPGNPRQDGPPPLRAVSGPPREGRDG